MHDIPSRHSRPWWAGTGQPGAIADAADVLPTSMNRQRRRTASAFAFERRLRVSLAHDLHCTDRAVDLMPDEVDSALRGGPGREVALSEPLAT